MFNTTNYTLACFTCRIAMKSTSEYERERNCARCGNPMLNMGKRFHAPPKRDVRQWRKIEVMLNHTWNWFKTHDYPEIRDARCSCRGCKNRGQLPQTLTEAKNLYEMRRSDKKDWQAPPKKIVHKSGPRTPTRKAIEARARAEARREAMAAKFSGVPVVCNCGHEGLERQWHASDCAMRYVSTTTRETND